MINKLKSTSLASDELADRENKGKGIVIGQGDKHQYCTNDAL